MRSSFTLFVYIGIQLYFKMDVEIAKKRSTQNANSRNNSMPIVC